MATLSAPATTSRTHSSTRHGCPPWPARLVRIHGALAPRGVPVVLKLHGCVIGACTATAGVGKALALPVAAMVALLHLNDDTARAVHVQKLLSTPGGSTPRVVQLVTLTALAQISN